VDTPRPSPRTNRTRRVPHPALIGHAASLTPYPRSPAAGLRGGPHAHAVRDSLGCLWRRASRRPRAWRWERGRAPACRGRGRGGEGLTAAEGPRQLSVRGAVLYGTLVPGEGGEADGVRVCGHAVTVIRGEMFFPDE